MEDVQQAIVIVRAATEILAKHRNALTASARDEIGRLGDALREIAAFRERRSHRRAGVGGAPVTERRKRRR